MKKIHLSDSGVSRPRFLAALAFCAVALSLTVLSFAGAPQRPVNRGEERATLTPQQTLEQLQGGRQNALSVQVSRKTGAYSFVKAAPGTVIVSADKAASPKTRAMSFLADNGGLIGMSGAEKAATSKGGAPAEGSELRIVKTQTDALGLSHVRFNQYYKGLGVFGAQVIVHMNDAGVTAVNGDFAPGVALSTVPAVNNEGAREIALATVRKGSPGATASVKKTELAIYPQGILEGNGAASRLAYAVEVAGSEQSEQVWIDAQNGALLVRIPLHKTAINRTIYSPNYDPANPNLYVQRREGDPPHPAPFVNNLYDFAGQTYNLYASGFGYASYDGLDKKMISVYLINEKCPNAYWNGQSTNYCPAFDADDVVSHEWSHAYTEYTHALIYAFQSGALNEAYSDIFGETVDLLNGVDGIGGNNNAQTYPNGQRWLVGEDLGEEVQQLLLRDMYDPDRLGDPGKVSSVNYACGTGDGGGVHTNSGVPNHGYALVVDGTQFAPGNTYNGQTVAGIGLTKAAAIYFRAESVYQVPTTGFADHATALQTSCTDLTGVQLKNLSTTNPTGTNSGQVITAGDCAELAKAMLAVEMSKPPICATGPLLNPDPAPICGGSNAFFSEDWETGEDGWTKTSMGFGTGLVDWEDSSKAATRFFHVVSSLPGGRTGSAAFAINPKVGQFGGGTCTPGGDYSGSHTLDSPAIIIPPGVTAPQLSFDHYVATEAGVDGGQVEISRNGGPYTLLPKSQYVFNPPNVAFNEAAPVGNNTGPNPNEDAWTGTNLGGAILGSWGTTVANLATVAQPGDSIKVRFTWSQDGCNGVEGWYIDNIRVFSCPVFQAPTLSTGADYENPDTNGSFTLNWVRPSGAVGPDLLQVSQTSCAPLISDNAEAGLAKWTTSSSGTGALQWKIDNSKPQHAGNTFNVQAVNGITNAASFLTYNNPITIPAGGQTVLSWNDWDVNEGDDNVFIDVSENNGATWAPVYLHNRSELGTGPLAFATESLFARSVDLTIYSGKTIRLRFRYSLGAEDRAGSVPLGWYVDDISMVNDNWTDVATTTGTSLLQSKGSGSYCYRVRTAYLVGSALALSPFSNIVNVTVVPGIVQAVSRKVHGGTHDIPLPRTGPAGVECRRGSGSSSNNHQVVFQFGQAATFTGASCGGVATTTSVSGNEVTVNCNGIANAQTVTASLLNVIDGTGPARTVSVPMSVLLGDTNADRSVNSADIGQTKSRSGQAVSAANFRSDVTVDGILNSADIGLVKSKSGTALP